MTLTKGNWIAYQSENAADCGQWAVALENEFGVHGIGNGEESNSYMHLGGICSEADALAMAAAPELLKALEGLTSALDSCVDLTPNVIERARAAIAKARGKA